MKKNDMKNQSRADNRLRSLRCIPIMLFAVILLVVAIILFCVTDDWLPAFLIAVAAGIFLLIGIIVLVYYEAYEIDAVEKDEADD